MQLMRKDVRLNGTLREYEHARHGKLTVLSYIDGVSVVWSERGWHFPGSEAAREQRIAELERLTGSPKKRRRKAAAEPPAKRRQA
jgi:hypothetical protein